MTNKTERFLVMSEAEFKAALKTTWECAMVAAEDYEDAKDQGLVDEMKEAEAACRSRVVPNWATHFAQIERGTDELERWEEIEK